MKNIEGNDILPGKSQEFAHEKYKPNKSEIGNQETAKDRQEAEELLKYLENIGKEKTPAKNTLNIQGSGGRTKQAEKFIQDHPEKTNRIIAGGELLKQLHAPQDTIIAGRMQKFILKILGPDNR